MPCGAVRFSQGVQLLAVRAVAQGQRWAVASNANSNDPDANIEDPDANSNTWPRFVPSANSDRFASKAGA